MIETVHLNDTVKVKLTDAGLEVLRQRHSDLKAVSPGLGNFTPPIVDEYGYSSFSLWQLMNTFGPFMGADAPAMFEHEIRI